MNIEPIVKIAPRKDESLLARAQRIEAESAALGLEVSQKLAEIFNEAFLFAQSAKDLTSVSAGVRHEAKILAAALEGSRKRIEALLERDPT